MWLKAWRQDGAEGAEAQGGGTASLDVLRFSAKAPDGSCILRRDKGERKRKRGSGRRGANIEPQGK